eukprot:32643_1
MDQDESKANNDEIILNVGLLGDSQVGKTSLMMRYIRDNYDDYLQPTPTIQAMDKSISFKNKRVTVTIWDTPSPSLDHHTSSTINTICNDCQCHAILFIFDLTQGSSLFSIKTWFQEARQQNKTFIPLLIGTKYDLFDELDDLHKQNIANQARKYAKNMHSPLIYCSSIENINIKKIFKFIVTTTFKLPSKLKSKRDATNAPLFELPIQSSEASKQSTGKQKQTLHTEPSHEQTTADHDGDGTKQIEVSNPSPLITLSTTPLSVHAFDAGADIVDHQGMVVIDARLFKNSSKQCSEGMVANVVNNCDELLRLCQALKYYTSLMRRYSKGDTFVKDTWVAFCINDYKCCIDDYIHVIRTHSEQLLQIGKELQTQFDFDACDVRTCALTLRHRCRGRSRRSRRNKGPVMEQDDPQFTLYSEIFETVHYYLFHLFDCGVRVDYNELYENYENDEALQEKLIQKQKELFEKRKELGLISEVNEENSNKFNIAVAATQKQDDALFLSELYFHMRDQKITHSQCELIYNFLRQEEYDSDTVLHDVRNLKSNILSMVHDEHLRQIVFRFVRNRQISDSAFSTGLIFYYWDYYKSLSEKETKQNDGQLSYNVNDHSGYNVKELYVKRKYKNLKEEMLCHMELNEYDELVLLKARQFIDCGEVRKIRAPSEIFVERHLHYGIQTGEPLRLENLICVIVYCDFSDLCTEFTATFRAVKVNESLHSIKERNRAFWWMSKILRETVQYFGENGYKEKGPFFTGMNCVMIVPSFNIRLCSPTSTSKQREIAVNFAKSQGMIIQMNNLDSHCKILRFWDCSWISRYPDEAERLFFGGDWKIRVQSIMLVATCTNFGLHFNALYLLDCMLNGTDMEDAKLRIGPTDETILSTLINYRLQHSDVNGHDIRMNQYIFDTFDLFCYKQKQITINIHYVKRYFKTLANLIIHSKSQNKNLIKSDVFRCFDHTEKMVIYTMNDKGTDVDTGESYEFSLFSLLSAIAESISLSMKEIVIMGTNEGWLTNFCLTENSINSALQKVFNTKNFKLSFNRPRQVSFPYRLQDCLTISRVNDQDKHKHNDSIVQSNDYGEKDSEQMDDDEEDWVYGTMIIRKDSHDDDEECLTISKAHEQDEVKHNHSVMLSNDYDEKDIGETDTQQIAMYGTMIIHKDAINDDEDSMQLRYNPITTIPSDDDAIEATKVAPEPVKDIGTSAQVPFSYRPQDEFDKDIEQMDSEQIVINDHDTMIIHKDSHENEDLRDIVWQNAELLASDPNYSHQQQYSRAATYANKPKSQYQNQPRSHNASNSMAANSNASQNDIETTRSDMRDILWQNAELLQSDPNYRKKVWRYMSKVFYGNQSNRYNFDNYKTFQLPTTVRITTNNNQLLNVTTEMKDNQKLPDREFDIITKAKLKLLLDREETYSDFLINSNPNQVILMNKVRPKMERILEAYACANDNKLALSGAVQLCAVILTTFATRNATSKDKEKKKDVNDSDCQDTFFILQILSEIMNVYSLEDEKLMKDETLLLIDVLCVNEDKLVRKLNQLCIDVIDLSVFVSSWIRCLFVHHFEIEFVQRVIDLVLLEGPSVLIAIVYGILQFIKNDILQCDTHYDVFEKLAGSKLKNYLKKHEFIARVIQKAQLLFTEENYKYVIKGREKKSWPDLLGLPGQRHFRIAKGVGDKTKVKKAYQHWRRESRKNITSAYLGAEESSDDSEDDDHKETDDGHHGMHHQHTSSTGYPTQWDKMQELQQMERKLADANETIMKLQTMHIKEDAAIDDDKDTMLLPSGPTMIEHNNSLVIHNEANESQIAETSGSKHKKQAPTLSDILYTSEQGDTIYCEPITDNLQPREIQCRTENWTDSWKHALSSLTDASISMQGYLCKMTASKFNSRGTLDKIQRRWFVLRGNYMTYYKTNLHTQPKSDKCVNLLGYKVNPVVHAKSKYAFELISAPKENQHKKSKSMKKNNYDQRYPSNTSFVERTKFILIPDLDVNEHKQREIRDKWVKSLRLATKGAFLWDVLLNLKVESPLAAAVDGDPTHRSSYDPHQHHHGHGYHAHGAQDHITSHTAFTSPHPHAHPQSVGTPPPSSSHGGYHSSYSKRNKGYHQSVLSAGHKNFKHSSDSLQAYSRRKYKQGNPNKKIGGNTQDYPDYRM